MVKGGGNADRTRGVKRRTPIGRSSDSSDEDYVVSEEENEVSDEDFVEDCDSLDGDVLEESVGWDVDVDVDEEEDDEEDEVVEVVRSKAKKSSKKKTRTKMKKKKSNRRGGLWKRRRVLDDEDEEEDDCDEDYYEEEDAEIDGGDDEDEDFSLDEYASLDEEDEFVVKKKRRLTNVRSTKGSGRGAKSRKKSRVSKTPSRKRTGRKRRIRNKRRYDDDDDDEDEEEEPKPVSRKRTRTSLGHRRRGRVISDSDFEASESSNYEYTISEEEREQVREAERLCKRLKADLRSSSTLTSTEDGNFAKQRKPPVKKGKEKVEEVIKEVVKQVCGICLSEEDKRRVRGTLDCCSHYFCFTCIMEWSKVESRCPLCKQRFRTISKPAKPSTGIDLKSVVVQVPERDQVYQPSEEELRGYMDPYENVICTECHQGGDDSLMLLCDLCDSPAHTYCVGLGHEVPVGNWYCDGCRPVALGSSGTQVQETPPDQRLRGNNFSNVPSPREALDLNSLPSSHETSFQGLGNIYSPRYPGGDAQAASPAPGSGAPTLSRRRWIHNHIQNLLSSNRLEFLAGRAEANAAASSARDFVTPQVVSRGTSFQHAETSRMGTLNNLSQENLLNNPPVSLPNQESFPFTVDDLRMQPVQDQSSVSLDRSIRGILGDDLRSMSSSGFVQQFQGNSISSMGSDGSLSPHINREGSHFYEAKERLQSMVKDHLKILSKDINLGHNTFKDVARSSTHTILAACRLEHRRNEVYPMPPPSACPHIEDMVIGQTSLMKGYCSSCFDSFIRDVVKTILNSRLPPWLVGSRA